MNGTGNGLNPPVYQAVLDCMGEGIIFAAGDDRIMYINRAAEEIRNFRADKFIGRHILDIHSPRSAEQIRSLLDGLKNGTIPFSTRVIEVKGKSFENSYYPIRDTTGDYVGTLLVSRDITEKKKLREENVFLREQMLMEAEFDGLVGRSPAMAPVFQFIEATACLDSTIMISGESGTGKELVALAIHRHSHRKRRPFVRFNCAALPGPLMDSELFGHERGAFTGAIRERRGKFEKAHQGTIFLDEITEIPLASQARLLRVIQERTIERIGGSRELKVDVRIIAATSRDLCREVETGRFREDLYYRLNVIPIRIPPLRERSEDILLLADFFLRRFCALMKKPLKGIGQDAKKALMEYHYPGNVRELGNAIERGVALCRGDYLALEHLPAEFSSGRPASRTLPAGSAARPAVSLTSALSLVEQELIREALRATGNRKGEAAKLLNISRKTLWEKLKQMG